MTNFSLKKKNFRKSVIWKEIPKEIYWNVFLDCLTQATYCPPLILRGRIIFSDCCSRIPKLDWDSKLEGKLKSDIEAWKKIIPLCDRLKVGRWIPLPKNKGNCFVVVAGDGGGSAFGSRAFILIPKAELPFGAPIGNVYINDTLVQRPGSDRNTIASFYVLSKIRVVSKSAKNWTSQNLNWREGS